MIPLRGHCSMRYLVYLLLLVCLEVLLTWVQPTADPSASYLPEQTLLEEGGQRMAAAASWLDGQPSTAAWERPLVSWPQSLALRVYGLNLASARALAALAALAALVGVAEILRRRWGVGVALFGALALAADPAWHALVRSPSVVPWAALVLTGVVVSSGGFRAWVVAVVATPVLAHALDPLLWLAGPSLLYGGLVRPDWPLQQRRWALGLSLALATMATIGLGTLISPQAPPMLEALMTWEERTRSCGALPLLLTMAFCGGCLRLAHGTSIWTGSSSLHALVWPGLLWLAVSGRPGIESTLVLFPALVLLAGESLALAAHRDVLPRRRLRPWLACALLGVGAMMGVYLALEVMIAVRIGALPHTRLAALAAGLCVILAHGLPVTARRLRARWMLPLACLLLAVPTVPRLRALLGEADHTVLRATKQLEGILLPTARCTGPLAAELTTTIALDAEPPGSAQRKGPTHLLVAHPRGRVPGVLRDYQAAGIGLEPVEILQVRGHAVHLYRLGDARIPLSMYEEAVRATVHGLRDEAEMRWLHLTSVHPQLAVAWSRLGTSLLARWRKGVSPGRWIAAWGAPPAGLVTVVGTSLLHELRRRSLEPLAFTCLMSAIQHDPGGVESRLALADIYYGQGLQREALYHLRAALAADPEHPLLRQWISQLPSMNGAP